MSEKTLANFVKDGWVDPFLKVADRPPTENELKTMRTKCMEAGRLDDFLKIVKLDEMPMTAYELMIIHAVCDKRNWHGAKAKSEKLLKKFN